jgi:pyruvate dehydrogenase E2 component (dihydrolipoamide acetyltransferase)
VAVLVAAGRGAGRRRTCCCRGQPLRRARRTAARRCAPPSMPLAVAPPRLPLGGKVHASPSVRAFARELGVDLGQVKASGPKGRILKEDVTAFVKGAMSTGVVRQDRRRRARGRAGWRARPAALAEGRLRQVRRDRSQAAVAHQEDLRPEPARNWVMIPAVTYHEDADITDLEAFRVQMNKENEKSGKKLTMLAFMIKASVARCRSSPSSTASLDGDNLV